MLILKILLDFNAINSFLLNDLHLSRFDSSIKKQTTMKFGVCGYSYFGSQVIKKNCANFNHYMSEICSESRKY